jgi:hypothetical protein
VGLVGAVADLLGLAGSVLSVPPGELGSGPSLAEEAPPRAGRPRAVPLRPERDHSRPPRRNRRHRPAQTEGICLGPHESRGVTPCPLRPCGLASATVPLRTFPHTPDTTAKEEHPATQAVQRQAEPDARGLGATDSPGDRTHPRRRGLGSVLPMHGTLGDSRGGKPHRAGRPRQGHSRPGPWRSPVRAQGPPTAAQGATLRARSTQDPSASRQAAPGPTFARTAPGRPLRPPAARQWWCSRPRN